MLSIKPIDSTAEMVSYYAHLGEAENLDYYSEDGDRPGVWWGRGAALLGLEGEVDAVAFENLLKGMSPGDGSKPLVQLRNGDQLKRRAGFDFTFSPVKSFSAVWAMANPKQRALLDAAGEKALYRTMDVVQDLLGITRRGKDGRIQEDADLVTAVFSHNTARPVPGEAPDCSKHYHVVIANVVIREDMTTGALDARVAFQRRMKMAIGALFRAELAKILQQELGLMTYRPKRERKQELAAWFEIKGVPTDFLKAMSKRRTQIEHWLRKHGLSGAKASEKATLRTRSDKERFSRQELSVAWEKLGREHKFTSAEVDTLFGMHKEVQVDSKQVSQKCLQSAIDSLIEQKARFTENELLERTAIEAQTTGLGIDDVLRTVCQAIEEKPEIVRLQDDRGVKAFTTREMLELEKRMIQRAERLHNRSSHAVPMVQVNQRIKQYKTLRPDQAKAVREMVEGSDIVTITGIAGSGKTFAISVTREILEASGYSLLGTSLASKASKGLERESGIKSLHIHKLLYEIDKGQITIDDRTVLFVDEAGMVGTIQLEKLISIVEEVGAKVVLVGDHKQLQAIQAGAPLRAIGEAIGTTEISMIVRQREKWSRDMVHDLRDGNAERALTELYDRGQLVVEDEKEELMNRLVFDWKKLVIEENASVQDTLVFAGMNADVLELNRRIQAVMLEAGQLGDYTVELDGFEVRLGDQVMVTKNHQLLGLRNGTMAEVVGVVEHRIWILTEDEIELQIDTQEFRDLSLAYAMSIYKGQGVTCENALVMTDNVMLDRESAYVSGSRHRGKVIFYADALSVGDIDMLAKRMNLSRPKEMALEHRLEVE